MKSDGRYYRLYGVGQELGFDDAVAECTSQNSQLAVAHDEAQWDVLQANLGKYFLRTVNNTIQERLTFRWQYRLDLDRDYWTNTNHLQWGQLWPHYSVARRDKLYSGDLDGRDFCWRGKELLCLEKWADWRHCWDFQWLHCSATLHVPVNVWLLHQWSTSAWC